MILYLLVALLESTAISESVGEESIDGDRQNWDIQAPPMMAAPAINKSLLFIFDVTN